MLSLQSSSSRVVMAGGVDEAQVDSLPKKNELTRFYSRIDLNLSEFREQYPLLSLVSTIFALFLGFNAFFTFSISSVALGGSALGYVFFQGRSVFREGNPIPFLRALFLSIGGLVVSIRGGQSDGATLLAQESENGIPKTGQGRGDSLTSQELFIDLE